MTRDEIVDFLEWAKEEGQLQFPESKKVDMAEMYIKEHDVVNKTCNIPYVSNNEVAVCPKCKGASNSYIHGFRTYCDRCGGTGQTDC